MRAGGGGCGRGDKLARRPLDGHEAQRPRLAAALRHGLCHRARALLRFCHGVEEGVRKGACMSHNGGGGGSTRCDGGAARESETPPTPTLRAFARLYIPLPTRPAPPFRAHHLQQDRASSLDVCVVRDDDEGRRSVRHRPPIAQHPHRCFHLIFLGYLLLIGVHNVLVCFCKLAQNTLHLVFDSNGHVLEREKLDKSHTDRSAK